MFEMSGIHKMEDHRVSSIREDPETIKLLTDIRDELRRLNDLNKSAFQDTHHELRSMKIYLERITK